MTGSASGGADGSALRWATRVISVESLCLYCIVESSCFCALGFLLHISGFLCFITINTTIITPRITATSTITIMRTKLTLLSSPPAKTENIAQGNRQGGSRVGDRGSRPPSPEKSLVAKYWYRPPSKSNWTSWVQFLLEGGPYCCQWNMLMNEKRFKTPYSHPWWIFFLDPHMIEVHSRKSI